MDNRTIAQHLLDHANYLESREVNLYRVRAYRKAAEAIMALDRRIADILVKDGRAGLETVPGIGSHLSYTLEYLVRTGEFRTLCRAIGHIDPERIFTSLPGVGPSLARRLHDELGITNLEELERAAHEGRLGALGIGPKRLRALIDILATRLARRRLPEPPAKGRQGFVRGRDSLFFTRRVRHRRRPSDESGLTALQILDPV